MNPLLFRRSFVISLLLIFSITSGVLMWKFHPVNRVVNSVRKSVVNDHGDRTFIPSGPGKVTMLESESQPIEPDSDSLLGEAAKAELRKNGQHESLAEALSAARHAVAKIDPTEPLSRGSQYFAMNPEQRLRAWFSDDGVEVAGRLPTVGENVEPWKVALRLRGIGRDGSLASIAAGTATGGGNRVEVRHAQAGIIQWFENRKDGLEQGFTIQQAPEGDGGEITLVLGVEGSLRAEMINPREGIRFMDATGAEVLHYTGLKAWDANGNPLATRFELEGLDSLSLVVADHDAVYPVTVDPLFSNVEARLIQSSEGDAMGASVAVSGDTAVVGVPGDSNAYVFVRSGTIWTQQAQLAVVEAGAFGNTVAISGNIALAGPYVFTRTGTAWTQQTKLVASDGAALSGSVALSGSTALIGAYVFLQSGSLWNQQAKLVASDGAVLNGSAALSVDTAVLGAPGSGNGSAYVFKRSGTIWSQQAKLTSSDVLPGDGFGRSVALSGDTVLVGAPDQSPDGIDYSGSVYIFFRSGTVWSQQSKLSGATYGGYGNVFGSSLALEADTAVVGAPTDGTGGDGSAHIFTRTSGVWSRQTQLNFGVIDDETTDYFGQAVALSGNTVLVGVPEDDTAAGINAGSAHVYTRSGSVWSLQSGFTNDDAADQDHSGYSVAISGETALVGAPDDGVAGGCVYAFARRGGTWLQQAILTGSDTLARAQFGSSVAFSGDTALIAAHNGQFSGSAYVFVRNGAIWKQQAKLTGTGFNFGTSVALEGNTALIGSTGSAFVYTRSGTTWSQQANLTIQSSDGRGISVAISGDTALVGAGYEDSATGAVDMGSVYVFVRSGLAWTQQTKLTASDGSALTYFGLSVSLSGNTALVGAPYTSTVAGNQSGGAYTFLRTGTVWQEQAKLTATDAGANDRFGQALALSGDIAIIGAPFDTTLAGSSGSAYVFARAGEFWNQQLKLTAGVDASPNDGFGISVALSGDLAIVGSWLEDTAGTDAGGAYAYLIGDLPEITQQPISRTIVPGQSATFSVIATGDGPLQYQWRKDGYVIAGASGTSYTIPSAQVINQGKYDCVVSNVGGAITSAPATLVVNALSQFLQAFPSVPPVAQGFVLVTLTPPGIGSWRFAGEQQWRSSGLLVGGLTTGDRNVEFRPVSGYIQPPSEVVSVVSDGTVTSVVRAYYGTPTSGSGGLSVSLKPASLAATSVPQANRAQWRLLGENDTQWRNSDTTLTGLVSGNYLVECKPVAGRSTPATSAVLVQNLQTAVATLTYFLADAVTGTPPGLIPFETVSTDTTKPFAYVGQIRSNVGSSSGFVVKQRVVATAGHVVFDDGTLAAVTGLQWLFQRHPGTYDPKPQFPRGYYVFDGYASQRITENTPGSSLPASQNLDVAALYFNEDAGRTGFSGFLASDATANEFLLSSAQKILVGYPVDGITASNQGRMHTTPAANVAFTRAFERTYTTPDIRSSGGMSGGPLCVQFESGNYYPAAIYLGGTGQTVVRSIDSQVIDLFARAEVSGNGGSNNTGGGITHTGITTTGLVDAPGALVVTILPTAAVSAGGRWGLAPDISNRQSGFRLNGLNRGDYILQLTTISGFQAPTSPTLRINGGQLAEITFTYVAVSALDTWRQANFQTTANTGDAADGADPDKDGQNNLSEFAADTNPNSASDVFKILTMTKNVTSFTVTAAGKASRSYVLERSITLNPGTWTTSASTGPLGSNGPVVLTDLAVPGHSAFYRLRVSAP